MTYRRPSPPNKPTEEKAPKPYKLITLPKTPPERKKPVGIDQFKPNHLSGKIYLRLTAKTPTFVASGLVAMGSDLSNHTKNIPLIRVAVGEGEKLILPGSSFKGCVRSIYEAITQSCLCKTKVNKSEIPNGYSECNNKTNLCPACRVFGAMGWQGLISFNDAVATEIKPSVGFMPSLFSPRPRTGGYYSGGKVAGRKFYYQTKKAVDKGQQGIRVQQAAIDLSFTTELGFMNLTEAELGTLLTALGQDKKFPFALKIGGGKPVGMGTMLVEVTEIDCPTNFKTRYLDYQVDNTNTFIGEKLQTYIQKAIETAKKQTIQTPQLEDLQKILQYPTNREAPGGMY